MRTWGDFQHFLDYQEERRKAYVSGITALAQAPASQVQQVQRKLAEQVAAKIRDPYPGPYYKGYREPKPISTIAPQASMKQKPNTRFVLFILLALLVSLAKQVYLSNKHQLW